MFNVGDDVIVYWEYPGIGAYRGAGTVVKAFGDSTFLVSYRTPGGHPAQARTGARWLEPVQ